MLISGTDSIKGITDSMHGDDISEETLPLPPHALPKTDDSLYALSQGFKMPRIDGIDDEPEVKPAKSDTTKLSEGLFGIGKGKHDFNDQADDILAETFDADIASAQ